MTEQVPSKELVRRIDDCLNRFWIDGVAEVRARGLLREAMEALRATAEPPADQPVAWVIPGDDNAYANGALDARISQEGEFTRPLYARPAPPPAHALTFAEFRRANVARCLKWHPQGINSWSPSDWLTAVTGELGELASLLKMRNRERDGLPGNKFSPTDKQVSDELADVLTYLDLLAEALDVDLANAAVEKFNEVSTRVGFPDRLGPTKSSARCQCDTPVPAMDDITCANCGSALGERDE